MSTGICKSRSARIFPGIVVFGLLLAPLASQAQSNTATGTGALHSNTTGYDNTANGFDALYSNTTGRNNTAEGYWTLFSNTTGSWNTANGVSALGLNTTGNNNTAYGYLALYFNTTGYNNTANGVCALFSNTTGIDNTASGLGSLYSNSTGSYNTADGFDALALNTTGNNNTANGYYALFNSTTGSFNTATGYQALYASIIGSGNTAYGYQALTSNAMGSNNTALGYLAGQNIKSGSNNIAIGNAGLSTDSGIIRIGTTGTHNATYIAGINGVTASGGTAVYVNANGQLGTLTSSRRFKKDIHDMGNVSEKLMQLRPVTFRYKQAAEDGSHPLQYGLIAEEVAKVYPDLVQYDKQGKPFTIYYHLLTPMLLSELQKEHRHNREQQTEIIAQKTTIAALKSELASLRQSQEQQFKVLAKLAALVQGTQSKAPVQKAVFVH